MKIHKTKLINLYIIIVIIKGIQTLIMNNTYKIHIIINILENYGQDLNCNSLHLFLIQVHHGHGWLVKNVLNINVQINILIIKKAILSIVQKFYKLYSTVLALLKDILSMIQFQLQMIPNFKHHMLISYQLFMQKIYRRLFQMVCQD